MAKKIEITVDVQSEQVNITSDRVLTLTEQLRLLKKEIQKAGPGKEQDLLIGKFNDINDELDKTNLKSREFLGALGTLPGPVGMFASSMDNAVNTLRNFTSFSFADIRTQAIGLAGDFSKIFTNIGRATGITKVYTTLNNALAASFVRVGAGEVAAAAGARAFAAALTATGIGAIVVALGFLISALIEWTTSTKDADAANEALNATLKEQERLLQVDLKAIDNATKANVLRAKIAGKTEQDIFQIQKQGGQDRLDALRKADKDNQKLIDQTSRNEVLTAEQKAEKLKELNEKSLKFGQDIIEQINANSLASQEFELQQVEKRRQKQEQANSKAVAANQKHREKLAEDNKNADDMLLKLQQENSVLLLADERKRQDKELEISKIDEETKINSLLISREKKNLLLAQIDEKYRLKQGDLDKKRKEEDKKKDEEDIKIAQDFDRKIADIRIAAMQNEMDRSIADRQQKLSNELADLEKDKEFIKRSEEEKAKIRKDIVTAAENDINKIKFDVRMKAAQDELAILEVQQRTLNSSTMAYYENAIAIENLAYQMKLDAAKGNAKQIEAINIEHAQNLKNIELASLEARKQIEIQRFQVIASIGNSLQQLAGKNKALAIGGIVVEKAAAIGQIWANNAIANAKATAVSPLTFGQPWVTINTVSAALSTAATIAAASKAISEINSGSASSGASSAAAPASQDLGRNYEKGGVLKGPRHAQGGVMIEAEGGEAVMTRGAVTMFAPMLSMMNQMGGGTSFGNQLFIRPDAAAVSQPAQEQSPMIMKTYVVSNELTSESEKQARLKDLSTL